MSLLNVWLAGDRALVGVDTDGVTPDGTRGIVNKMALLPHVNAVLAGRGTSVLLGCVYVQAMVLLGGGFDDVADKLPAMVETAFDQTIGGLLMRNLNRAAYQAAHEIVLVGWSPKHGRMRAIEVVRPAGGSAFAVAETERHYVAPWDESIKGAPDPVDIASMIVLAKAQVALIRGADTNAAAGGRLIVAELHKSQMTVRTVCALP